MNFYVLKTFDGPPVTVVYRTPPANEDETYVLVNKDDHAIIPLLPALPVVLDISCPGFDVDGYSFIVYRGAFSGEMDYVVEKLSDSSVRVTITRFYTDNRDKYLVVRAQKKYDPGEPDPGNTAMCYFKIGGAFVRVVPNVKSSGGFMVIKEIIKL